MGDMRMKRSEEELTAMNRERRRRHYKSHIVDERNKARQRYYANKAAGIIAISDISGSLSEGLSKAISNLI
jgi:hypothetical protein